MTRQFSISSLTCAVLAGFILIVPVTARAQATLSLKSATVSLEGSSNIHDYTASTKDVRLTRLTLAGGAAPVTVLTNPAAVETFEVVIKAATLASSKDGLDKNMHKALKVTEFPDIVFRLDRLEGSAPAMKAVGVLKIAGVEKEIAIDLKVAAAAATLAVSGQVPMLMTDFGIAPPKAMMGVLKTSPKITVKFETVFAVPATF